MRYPTALALLTLLALGAVPAHAADEPEVVYGKFHRAAMAGDLDEMLKYGPAQRRAEMRGLPEAHRDASLKLVRSMMPRAFKLERKSVGSTGRAATLIVSGPWQGGDAGMETMYGTIRMLVENGECKVDEASWNTVKPAVLSTPTPAPAPNAADKAGISARGAAAKGGAPVVGSMESGTVGRKLGAAKPECVYKPVMTAQDMENCK